jgi:hypothetical protein
MNKYVGGHVFLTSVVVRGEWSASRLDRFNLTERSYDNQLLGGCVGSRTGMDKEEKRQILFAGMQTPALVQSPDAS